MRVMGLDYGEQTVGVAISDATMTLATPLEIIRRDRENALRETLRRIEELCRIHEVSTIVLGLPLHLDGGMSDRAEKTLAFRDKLTARLQIPVTMQDERLTSVEAEERLREEGIPKKDWKKDIDRIAAAIILQDYLNGKTDL
ncbi:MAG: Holliday junction resolvase RuvX [Lachnospiraceae bacterium]|nr:Holliday junction resolvase RuvX [Lachnospiraceae bacterium]